MTKLKVPKGIQYYDLKKYWYKVKPHLADPIIQETLQCNFHKFTFGRWEQPFLKGQLPHKFESCGWHLDHRGRKPAFWYYTKHAACHWIVNFALELAKRVEPDRDWRILTSDEHSTVWDGVDTLFDFNFQAFGIPAAEAFRLAAKGRLLYPGVHLQIGYAESVRAA